VTINYAFKIQRKTQDDSSELKPESNSQQTQGIYSALKHTGVRPAFYTTDTAGSNLRDIDARV
jgi:hypothetical protein